VKKQTKKVFPAFRSCMPEVSTIKQAETRNENIDVQ
jgi:hypothetical protein